MRTEAELSRIRRAGATGTPQARSERDAFAGLRESRLAQLHAVEERLCFGRLDLRGAQHRYIGRLGLFDDDQRQLLVDWRAPAATDFYRATAVAPGEVVRRRHLLTKGRTVTAIEDEVLDLAAFPVEERDTLVGEGVLLSALTAARTGRMADIVATIQGEQDRVIRSDMRGPLVVQGGPGTGKTAVALHRTAYLLYTHRERLSRSGVLLVGPSPVFLRYIERVLPSLGETGVVTTTPGELFPGVLATAAEAPEVAALKGDLRMVHVMAAAVRNRQRLPDGPRLLDVEGTKITLDPQRLARAAERARRTGAPHNQARVTFVVEMLEHLADEVARTLGARLGVADRGDVIADLRASRDVRRELNLAWPPLSAAGLLTDLFARPDRLEAAAAVLSPAERELLHRDRDAPFTVADIPLLDEIAELIGTDDEAARAAARRAAAERAEEVAYAREVLRQVGGQAAATVSAETLAQRFASPAGSLSVVERAMHDRAWEYGHIVVDEAQELSPMMWRLLMRRCPSRSMTLVGDLAQTGSAAGARSWAEVLDHYAKGRWRMVELSVNYRTPAQVMQLAASTLAGAGVEASVPRSVREGLWPPMAHPVAGPPEQVDQVLVELVGDELAVLEEGRLAVIGPRAGHDRRLAALLTGLPTGSTAAGLAGLDTTVGVFTVEEVKGLEFDVVVLVEPAAILEESRRGANDLYVAMTRPTQRLHVVHARPLPAGMEGIGPHSG